MVLKCTPGVTMEFCFGHVLVPKALFHLSGVPKVPKDGQVILPRMDKGFICGINL